MQSAMPNIESKLQEVEGSHFFSKLEFCQVYWYLSLAPELQEMLSVPTTIGVYLPKRLLQGVTDSGNHLQAVTQTFFRTTVKILLQWLDDFLIHGKTKEVLLDDISKFFEICK